MLKASNGQVIFVIHLAPLHASALRTRCGPERTTNISLLALRPNRRAPALLTEHFPAANYSGISVILVAGSRWVFFALGPCQARIEKAESPPAR